MGITDELSLDGSSSNRANVASTSQVISDIVRSHSSRGQLVGKNRFDVRERKLDSSLDESTIGLVGETKGLEVVGVVNEASQALSGEESESR